MLAVEIVVSLLVACGISLIWKVVTRWVKQTPLRNIPGPPSKSLWSGQCYHLRCTVFVILNSLQVI